MVRDEIDEHVRRFKPENEAGDIIDAFLLEIHKAEVNGDKDSSFSRKPISEPYAKHLSKEKESVNPLFFILLDDLFI